MNRYKAAFQRLYGALDYVCEKYNKKKAYFLFDALKCRIRYGITPNEYMGFGFYAKSKVERAMFYTERHTHKFEKLLNKEDYADLFWDKQKFNKRFADYISRKWLYVAEATKEEVEEFLVNCNKVIVKPTSLSSGHGIHLYNGETYEQLKEADALIEEFVEQVDELATLNPSSVNTIRIYTILDENNVPFILSAALRVGAKGSCVDNFHNGGVGYPIDVEHGIISGAGYDISGKEYLYHPGTDVKAIGFEIPRWDEVKQFIFKACLEIPESRLIAWDVAVTKKGLEMIEGNYKGDAGFMQAPAKKGKLREIKKYGKVKKK